MSKAEVVPEDESALESCLHCEINDLVQEHVEGQETVDIADLAGSDHDHTDRVLPAAVTPSHRVLSPASTGPA